jgi:hypothetical protein
MPLRSAAYRLALRQRMKAGLMFDPWIMVWQLMQDCTSAEPAPIPWIVPAATGLWHWLHIWLMLGTFSSRAF